MNNDLQSNRRPLSFGPRELVPCNLTLDRAWRWCIEATLRDLRIGSWQQRQVSGGNARRLFMRRWSEACRLFDVAEDSEHRALLMECGTAAVEEGRRSGRAGLLVAQPTVEEMADYATL